VLIIWSAGFISWILGCSFWVQQAEVLSMTFISSSIILCFLAIVVMPKTNLTEFPNLGKADLGLSVYVLFVSISVVIMVASKSYANGIITNILLLLSWYTWREYEKPIKTRTQAY
jgi:hypothetical protein